MKPRTRDNAVGHMQQMTNTRKTYEAKLDAQFDKWSAQIALLKAKADKAKAEGRIEYYQTIEALQHKQDMAGTKLHQHGKKCKLWQAATKTSIKSE